MPSLCFVGFSSQDDAAARRALEEARQQLPQQWQIVDQINADLLVIDLDSIYGQMAWMQLHNSSKPVIGVTAAERADSDYTTPRPLTASGLAVVLSQYENGRGHADSSATPVVDATAAPSPSPEQPVQARNDSESIAVNRPQANRPQPMQAATAVVLNIADNRSAATPVAENTAQASRSHSAPGQARISSLLVEAQQSTTDRSTSTAYDYATAAEPLTRGAGGNNIAAATPATRPVTGQPPVSAPRPVAVPPSPSPSGKTALTAAAIGAAAATAAGSQRLIDYIAAGYIQSAVEIDVPGLSSIAIDPVNDRYFGPTSLKPLIDYGTEKIPSSAIKPASALYNRSDSEFPLHRLVWLLGLASGKGQLASHVTTFTSFRLNRWPETEREFPKHFRIATMMMKGPTSISAICSTTGLDMSDVIDYINAGLAIGLITAENGRSDDLLRKLRGR